jgi:hypothetical protein
MDKTLEDFRLFEHNLLKNVFARYIKPKHPELTFTDFKNVIVRPLHGKVRTQKDIIDEEIEDLESYDEPRCQFVILDGNKMRRCKCKPLDDDLYCHHHQDKDDELAAEYMDLKRKYLNHKK